MAKREKIKRPQAAPPKGFRDYFGNEVRARQEMLQKLGALYHHYGFDPLETSAVETVEALGKFLPDVDRPNEGVFAWQDEDETWLALRYDLTAPLARVVAQFRNDLPMPYRRYAMGPVWRNEKPGPGRFRQFYQCDADTVGAPSIAADAEIITLMAAALEHLGIERNDYVVRVNNRKIMNGVMENAGLLGDENEVKRGITLRAIDKFDKFGEEGVRALLGKGRLDESGDFTTGAGLSDEQVALILGFVDAGRADDDATIANLANLVGTSNIGRQGIDELQMISELVRRSGYDANTVKIDPSVVRGLGYYTGPVFEAELTFEILDEKGRPRQFGSVAGGGRYDDLVKRFTGQDVPATGMSIGVDRLLAALTMKGLQDTRPAEGPVLVTIFDRDRLADYQEIVSELRQAGIRAELYLGNPKDLGKQLKYADARHARFAIIQGENERNDGNVMVKDLYLGAELSETMESREDWVAQPAQEAVARTGLVDYLKGKTAL